MVSTVITYGEPTLVIDRVLYEPSRLAKIAEEAARDNSIFTLNDRLGLVYDCVALSKAGLAKLSTALNLINIVGKKERECKMEL